MKASITSLMRITKQFVLSNDPLISHIQALQMSVRKTAPMEFTSMLMTMISTVLHAMNSSQDETNEYSIKTTIIILSNAKSVTLKLRCLVVLGILALIVAKQTK